MNYSDPGELSWVDEGLADFAVFLNGYDIGGSHLTYHQVFYADTSLTKWGGGLQNYGASYTFFQYLWEQAGGNGDGTYTPDLEYDGAGGDLLIKLIFENQADSTEGVQAAIDEFNAQTGAGLRDRRRCCSRTGPWPSTSTTRGRTCGTSRPPTSATPRSRRWTMDIADDVFWSGRGASKGAQPGLEVVEARQCAEPDRGAVRRPGRAFRNPGPTVNVALDGEDATQIAPHTGEMHWYAGYESQSDNILDVDVAGTVTSLDFWTWHFIEEGWDYGVRRGARRRRVGHRTRSWTTQARRSPPTTTRMAATRTATG